MMKTDLDTFLAFINKTEINVKSLQCIYNEIVKILKENNVTLNITPPRPFLKRGNEKLYFDEAWKYKNFD